MSQSEEFSKGGPDHSPTLSALWADEYEAPGELYDSQNDPPTQTLYLIGSAFFLSGLAAVTYEVVWQRVLVRVIGSTTPAIATIICAFMAGLALGGFAGAELAKRRGNQLVVMAVLELLICITALISIAVCQDNFIAMLVSVLRATINSGVPTMLIGFVMIFAIIAIPTALMGATLPVIAGFFARSSKRGLLLTRFYAINSAGAVFGAFMSGFFFLPMLGISGSLIFASGLNLLASTLAFLASRSVQVSQFSAALLQNQFAVHSEAKPSVPGATGARETYFNASVALFTSTLSFTMQIVWTGFLVFLFGSSTHALSLVLSVYIAGLSVGAWLVGREKGSRKTSRTLANIPLTLSITSLAMACVLHQFQATPEAFLCLKKSLLEHIGSGFWCDSLALVLLAIPLILIPSILIGMIFPLLLIAEEGNAARTDQLAMPRITLPKRTAILYSASLLGSVIACAYSYTLRPVLARQFTSGLESTTILVAVLYALGAIILLVKQFGGWFRRATPALLMSEAAAAINKLGSSSFSKNPKERISPFTFAFNTTSICLTIVALTAATICFRPKWDAMLIASGLSTISRDDLEAMSVSKIVEALKGEGADGRSAQQLLMYREGLNNTVSVVEKPSANLIYLRNNGKVEAAVPIDPLFPAPESDLPTQKLLGLIPVLHCSGENLEGLVIGYGSGTTCSAILPAPWVQSLTAVELEQAVWDARTLFPTAYSINNLSSNRDGQRKLITVIADARNYLSLHDQKFDFIASQPPEPWLSGASDLFTVEFYQLVKQRLKGTGLFCQWVPIYSLTPAQLRCLVQTFQHVFPQTTIWHPKRAGELVLAGQVGAKIRPAIIDKRLESDSVGLQLQEIGIQNQADLYSNAIQLPPSINQSLEDIVLNTDDNLLIEGKLSKGMNGSTQNIDDVFKRVFGDEKEFRYATPHAPKDENSFDHVLALSKRTFQGKGFATDNLFFTAVAGHDSKNFTKQPPPIIPNYLTGNSLMRFYLHTGNPEKAAALLKTLDTRMVTDYETLCDLGTVQFLAGDYATALSTFKNAERNSMVSHSQANAGVGLCLWMTGQKKDAIQPLSASLKIDPNQFLARYALGQALFSSGMKLAGLKNMRAAAVVDPTSALPGVFVTADDIERGDWQSAHTNLQLARKRSPQMLDLIVLGCYIALKTDQNQNYSDLKKRYQDITARDITESDMREVVKSILSTPHIITKL